MEKVKPEVLVGRDIIDRVRRNVADLSEEALHGEFDDFFSKQREICEFVTDLMSEGGQPARELCLFLAYMVYKTAKEHGGSCVQPVDAQKIAAACSESRKWIEKMDSLSGTDIDHSSVAGRDGQFHLLGFVIGEINGITSEDLELTEQDKGRILFVLKTVILSLTWSKG